MQLSHFLRHSPCQQLAFAVFTILDLEGEVEAAAFLLLYRSTGLMNVAASLLAVRCAHATLSLESLPSRHPQPSWHRADEAFSLRSFSSLATPVATMLRSRLRPSPDAKKTRGSA